MSKVESRVRGLAVLVLGLVAVAAIGLWGLDARPGAAGGVGGMTAMSVDMITTGNTATALGANSPCIFVHPDGSLGSDVTVDVTALSIPASYKMVGYAYVIGYDDTDLGISAFDSNFLLANLPGSALFGGPGLTSDPLPDPNPSDPTPDGYSARTADLGDTNTTAESGSGVLDRLTFHAAAGAAAGKYPLTLSAGVHIDTTNASQPALVQNSGAIAVDRSCYQGDVDCSNAVNSIDALKILRKVAALSVAAPVGCPFLTDLLAGNVDCSVGPTPVNSIDALKVLRYAASLPVSQTEPCDDIGT